MPNFVNTTTDRSFLTLYTVLGWNLLEKRLLKNEYYLYTNYYLISNWPLNCYSSYSNPSVQTYILLVYNLQFPSVINFKRFCVHLKMSWCWRDGSTIKSTSCWVWFSTPTWCLTTTSRKSQHQHPLLASYHPTKNLQS